MSHTRAVAIAHLPPSIGVHVALFTDVKNAAFLRAQLLAGNQAFEYAFVDASTLVSTAHLLAAVFRACSALTCSPPRLRTRNVHAETVFCLSPTNNIAESFKRFGVGDETSRLVAVKISHPASEVTLDDVQKHLEEAVEGTSVAFDSETLESCTDWTAVTKVYKLQVGPATGGSKKSSGAVDGAATTVTAVERKKAEVSVLGMMALKGS